MNTKNCSICNKEKPLNEFVKDKNKKDGVRNYCKKCLNLSKRKTPIKLEAKEGFKICSKCDKELSLSEFNFRTTKGVKKAFSYCKECERTYNRNKYHHICKECGKKYNSGKKQSNICKECYNKVLGEIGRKNIIIKNANQFGKNNHMYGIQRFGKFNPNYNPNLTNKERETKRLSVEGYGVWRRDVFERDNYICQCCGYDKGGIIRAHHLYSWDLYQETRLKIDNGITLCNKCHKEFHFNYGYGNNTKEQFYEFKNKNYNK